MFKPKLFSAHGANLKNKQKSNFRLGVARDVNSKNNKLFFETKMLFGNFHQKNTYFKNDIMFFPKKRIKTRGQKSKTKAFLRKL